MITTLKSEWVTSKSEWCKYGLKQKFLQAWNISFYVPAVLLFKHELSILLQPCLIIFTKDAEHPLNSHTVIVQQCRSINAGGVGIWSINTLTILCMDAGGILKIYWRTWLNWAHCLQLWSQKYTFVGVFSFLISHFPCSLQVSGMDFQTKYLYRNLHLRFYLWENSN